MGEPILDARKIPAAADGRMIDYPLEVGGRIERITAVSMGNPHCVVFVEDDHVFRLDDHDFAGLGRQFESHRLFPDRVNTEFILPVSRRHLRMRVWERGSGETLGCGTGACAALVAAVLTGRAERNATVELRGGKLEIEWREGGEAANHVFMTGDAVEVFRGQVETRIRRAGPSIIGEVEPDVQWRIVRSGDSVSRRRGRRGRAPRADRMANSGGH